MIMNQKQRLLGVAFPLWAPAPCTATVWAAWAQGPAFTASAWSLPSAWIVCASLANPGLSLKLSSGLCLPNSGSAVSAHCLSSLFPYLVTITGLPWRTPGETSYSSLDPQYPHLVALGARSLSAGGQEGMEGSREEPSTHTIDFCLWVRAPGCDLVQPF